MGANLGTRQEGDDKMTTAPFSIRSATNGDIPAIWRLLHSDGRSTDDAAIASELPHFYLLFQGTKLLGVYRDGSSQRQPDYWAAVHPLYSQGLVEDILHKTVNGLINGII
jgi:hypothetical protein